MSISRAKGLIIHWEYSVPFNLNFCIKVNVLYCHVLHFPLSIHTLHWRVFLLIKTRIGLSDNVFGILVQLPRKLKSAKKGWRGNDCVRYMSWFINIRMFFFSIASRPTILLLLLLLLLLLFLIYHFSVSAGK